MKIVVLDGYTLNPGDLSWDRLEELGEVDIYDRTSYSIWGKQLIIDRCKDAEIVLTNKTPLDKGIIDCLPNLKYIGVMATGFNVVDVQAAKERGVIVTNIPTYGTAAVAQMTIALLLEMCHHVGSHSDAVFNGDWARNPDWCFWNYPLIELAGKTIGLIGYGRIGQNVGQIAQALGMNVLANSNNPKLHLENENMKYVDLYELLEKSDVISLHCPLLKSTEGMINKDTISKMKENVMIINTSRGQLIVEEDLARALNEGRIAGAAVDVVSSEPIDSENPLLKAKNCLITPHISWAPKESRTRLMNLVLDNIESYLRGKPNNVVNK